MGRLTPAAPQPRGLAGLRVCRTILSREIHDPVRRKRRLWPADPRVEEDLSDITRGKVQDVADQIVRRLRRTVCTRIIGG